jgi:hypothetical protein
MSDLTDELVGELLTRLDDVEARFAAHAPGGVPDLLTDADPKTGEQWDAGQVWAHTAEFPSYWVEQVRLVLDGWSGSPVPFGRVKTDPDRIAAIERDRHEGPGALLDRVRDGIRSVRELLADLPSGAWEAEGEHSTLGVMSLERILDEFLVAHLEEHACQLDQVHTPAGT